MEQLTQRRLVGLFVYFGDLVGHVGQMQMTGKKAQYKYFPNPGFFTIVGVFARS